MPEFGFALALVKGLTEIARLELEDLGLPGVGSDLVFNGGELVFVLLALKLELTRLEFEQVGLLPR